VGYPIDVRPDMDHLSDRLLQERTELSKEDQSHIHTVIHDLANEYGEDTIRQIFCQYFMNSMYQFLFPKTSLRFVAAFAGMITNFDRPPVNLVMVK
jgi:hypothetical protein